jgi:hypothetical protein
MNLLYKRKQISWPYERLEGLEEHFAPWSRLIWELSWWWWPELGYHSIDYLSICTAPEARSCNVGFVDHLLPYLIMIFGCRGKCSCVLSSEGLSLRCRGCNEVRKTSATAASWLQITQVTLWRLVVWGNIIGLFRIGVEAISETSVSCAYK